MFFSLQVDRGNLAQAVSDNMLEDLGLDTNWRAACGRGSGVGDSELWEKVGKEGAVELGELGRDRLACR